MRGQAIGSPSASGSTEVCSLSDALAHLRAAASELLNDIDFLQSADAVRLLGAGDPGVALAASRSLTAARQRLDDAVRGHAALLGSFGVPQRTVAQTLNVSTNTVTRWGRERESAPTS